MRLTKVVKTHKDKDSKEFKKCHFYLYLNDTIKVEILPSDYKLKNGKYNNHCSEVLRLFAEKEDKE